MPKSLTTSENNILRPEDFDPPLKRQEPSLPGYWTLEEIASEINLSTRRVGYDITGYPQKNIKPNLKAFKVDRKAHTDSIPTSSNSLPSTPAFFNANGSQYALNASSIAFFLNPRSPK